MAKTQDRLYDDVAREVNLPYIIESAASIRKALDGGCPLVDIDFMPDDGTRYPITFSRLSDGVTIGPLRAWPGVDVESAVLVSMGGGYCRCYAINLLARNGPLHHSYVAEHLMGREPVSGSSVVIAMLLSAIAGFPPDVPS